MRLRSDIWVAAYLRRCAVDGVSAVLRRRGAAEAGAIFVKIDRLNGEAALYGPAPQTLAHDLGPGVDRVFTRQHKTDWIDPADAERRLTREIGFDPDLWIIEAEDREGRHRLDLAEPT
jgi:hypothetical protein